jgi:NAD(P)-dependent dehydrogenase (short-subunit alcohol dehydrogenase family)
VAKFAPIADTTEKLFDEIFDINVRGTFFMPSSGLCRVVPDGFGASSLGVACASRPNLIFSA